MSAGTCHEDCFAVRRSRARVRTQETPYWSPREVRRNQDCSRLYRTVRQSGSQHSTFKLPAEDQVKDYEPD
jgi:hypothetical protein